MHDLHLPEHVGMAQVLAFRRHVGVDLLTVAGPVSQMACNTSSSALVGLAGRRLGGHCEGPGKAGL